MKTTCHYVRVTDRFDLVNVEKATVVIELSVQRLKHTDDLDRLRDTANRCETNNIAVEKRNVLDTSSNNFFTYNLKKKLVKCISH